MTNDEIAMLMANKLLCGEPIPDYLINSLMESVCEEVKQERERGATDNNKETVA